MNIKNVIEGSLINMMEIFRSKPMLITGATKKQNKKKRYQHQQRAISQNNSAVSIRTRAVGIHKFKEV